MTRSRPSQGSSLAVLLAPAILLAAGACEAPTGASCRALGSADGSLAADGSADAAGCGSVSAVGCCQGNKLRFCASGVVVSKQCVAPLSCGWDASYGLYACTGKGGADPTGVHPWSCGPGDAGTDSAADSAADLAKPDGPGAVDGGSCGGVSFEGCCLGSTLLFCSGGAVLSLSCLTNPKCGWNGAAGFYDCGTSGQAESSGKHPMACPAGLGDAGASPDLLSVDMGADASAPDAGSPGEAGPSVDRGATGDGFILTPDLRPAPETGAADRPGREASGLDLSGLEGGVEDMTTSQGGGGDPGCSCSLGSREPGGSGVGLLALCLAALLSGRASRRRRGLALAAAALALLCLVAACPAPGEEGVGARTRALIPDALAGDGPAAAGCGKITAKGCCDGETLWWCSGGALKKLSCLGRPHCGWSNSSRYDCDTSGAADPAGVYPAACSALAGDNGVPASDLKTEAGALCGAVTREGCCQNETLVYCREGRVKTIHCGLNPSCGWHPGGQLYDCGTSGGSDPSGKHPRTCPAQLPGDSLSLDGPRRVDGPLTDSRVDLPGRSDGPASRGQGCEVGRSAEPGGLWLWLLAALPGLRRRSRARGD